MSIKLSFLGAARHVTGSKHLLTVGGQRILLDCGLVQGPRRLANEANRNLPVGPGDVDVVVLSHAHIDHCGALPRLVKQGFDGAIWCTEGTADLLRVMLLDAAKIQVSDARYLRKHGHAVEPLYDEEDVQKTLRLVRAVPYHQSFEPAQGARVEFLDAGHILGAAIVVIDAESKGVKRRIVFTGDHGRKQLPILKDPERIPACDVLITESTYGDRSHEELGDMKQQLADIVREEMQDGGRLLIPAFAVGRTQHVVLFLGELMQKGSIPRIPVFVDSPMSQEATKVMARHPDLFDAETAKMLREGHHPFYFDGVRYVADVEESMSLNALRSGVIVAASGMCESGRILHHLKQSVGRKEDCVLIVGFQADGTLGRKLLDGWDKVKILGDEFDVRCKVRFMPGFSAHADGDELFAASRHLAATCRNVFVVHGEEPAANTYAQRLRDAGFQGVEVPAKGDEFTVG